MPTERRQVGVSFVDPDSIVAIESHMGSRGRTAVMGLLLVAVVLGVYARALWGGFIYLDDQTIVENLPLRSVGPGLWNIWVHPTVSPHYQPLAYSLFLAEFRVFTTRLPGGYLAVNVLLHLCNVLLLWVVLRRLEVSGAWVAALIFSVHPMNVQAVGWISQQPLLLCGVFSLLAILVWLRFAAIDPSPPDTGKIFRLPESRWMLYVLVILLMECALASHSIAVALPVVMGALIWWERARISRAEVRAILPLVAMSLVWAVVTSIVDSRRAAGVGGIDDGLAIRALMRLGAAWGYVWNLLLPIWLSLIYPKGQNDLVMGGVMAMAVAAVLAIAWRLRPRLGRGPFAAVIIVLALLAPTLLIRSDLDQWSSRADQLFYLPGAVLIVAIVGAVVYAMSMRPRWKGQTATAVAAALLAALTVVRLDDFRDSRRLWGSALRHDPDSLLALDSLGMIDLEERNFPQARERFNRALQAHPKELRPLLNLARSYELAGDLETMLMRYQEALANAPDDLDVHLGLGTAYAGKGNQPKAIEQFDFVLAKSPKHYQARYRLGLSYRAMGDLDRAAAMFKEAIELNPADAAPYIDLANIAFARGDFETALQTLETAARIDVRNFRIYLNVGAQLGTLAEDPRLSAAQRAESSDKAEAFLRTAVILNSSSPEARYNLGGLLFNRGKLDEAIFQLGKAVELSPRNADFRQALAHAQAARQASGSR